MVGSLERCSEFCYNSHDVARFIRNSVIKMTSRGRSSHVGSCLSIADILAVLYSRIMRVFPLEPDSFERDIFILSKGHAGAAVYSVLAFMGFFEKDLLKEHYQNGSLFSGHVSHKGIPGVELSTGSLGQGLSVAAGFATSFKKDVVDRKVYVLLSDGECDEGSTWEAAMFSAHHKLSNLTAIIDYNKLQSLTTTEKTLSLEPFEDKWRAFGWDVKRCDGHDHKSLIRSLASSDSKMEKPRVVICDTTKGKGVSFMENSVLWHYRAPNDEERDAALKELGA